MTTDHVTGQFSKTYIFSAAVYLITYYMNSILVSKLQSKHTTVLANIMWLLLITFTLGYFWRNCLFDVIWVMLCVRLLKLEVCSVVLIRKCSNIIVVVCTFYLFLLKGLQSKTAHCPEDSKNLNKKYELVNLLKDNNIPKVKIYNH